MIAQELIVLKMDVTDIISKMNDALKDRSMPRRVRETINRISTELTDGKHDMAIQITSAIYELDAIATDINIPMHAKTILWDLISDLEALRE